MIDLEVLNRNMETLELTLEEDISGRNIGTKDKMKFKDKDGYLYSLSSGKESIWLWYKLGKSMVKNLWII